MHGLQTKTNGVNGCASKRKASKLLLSELILKT